MLRKVAKDSHPASGARNHLKTSTGDTRMVATVTPAAKIRIAVATTYHCKHRYTGSQRQQSRVTTANIASAATVCFISAHPTPVVMYSTGQTKPNTQLGGWNREDGRCSAKETHDDGASQRMRRIRSDAVLTDAPKVSARTMSMPALHKSSNFFHVFSLFLRPDQPKKNAAAIPLHAGAPLILAFPDGHHPTHTRGVLRLPVLPRCARDQPGLRYDATRVAPRQGRRPHDEESATRWHAEQRHGHGLRDCDDGRASHGRLLGLGALCSDDCAVPRLKGCL